MIDAVLANFREYWMVHSLLALYTVMLAHHAWTGNRRRCACVGKRQSISSQR